MDKIRKFTDKYLFKHEISIETRLSIFFIMVGVMAALLGLCICIASGVSTAGSLVVLMILIVVPMSMHYAYRYGRPDIITGIILIAIIIMMPIIWMTAGGVESGVNSWFVYEFFFIAIALKGEKLKRALIVAAIADVCCFVISWFAPEYIFVLKERQDVYISTFGSLAIVAATIVATTVYYKRIYDDEKEQLKEANNFQKEFLASFSHELRSPINAILGLNEMIIRSDNIDEIREMAIDANEAGENLMFLINDILDFTKIESGGMTLTQSEYSPRELLNKSHALMANRAKTKGLEFEIKNNPSVPEKLEGDEMKIRQIVTNLLTNAVKYTDKGSVCMVLTSEYLDEDNVWLRIDVIDTGIGIAPENLDEIFNSFQRMDLNRNKNIEGTGLGLSITKSLVEMLNGTITVKSQLLEGSIFTVKIPQKIVERNPMGSYTRKSMKSKLEYKEQFRAPEAKLLIVDDIAVNLKVAEGLLKNTEMQIRTAQSGREALDIIDRTQFDIILLDHMMPEMDGVEVFREIRRRNIDTPIIVLTANALPGMREEYLKVGFSDYLSKPIKPLEIEKMLMKYLPEEKITK